MTTDKKIIGYSDRHNTVSLHFCISCDENEPEVTKEECEPVYADDIGNFDGKSPGCYYCGEDIFPPPEWTMEDELAERRREYNDDIRADFRRLGLVDR